MSLPVFDDPEPSVIPLDDAEPWPLSTSDKAQWLRLKNALAERNAQLKYLNRLAQTLARSLDVTHIGQVAIDQIRAMANFDVAGVALIDEAREWLMPIALSGVSATFTAGFGLHKRAAARVIRRITLTGHPFIIEDLRTDTYLPASTRRLMVDEGLRTAIGFVIPVEGRAQGLLMIGSRSVATPDEVTLQVLEAAIGYLGQALTNASRYRREQRRAAEQQALLDILRIAVGQLRLGEMLPQLARNASRLFHTDDALIALWDQKRTAVFAAAGSGVYQTLPRDHAIIPADRPTLVHAVMQAGQPIAVYDSYDSPYSEGSFFQQLPRRSLLSLPLIARGRTLGALVIGSTLQRHFTQEEIDLGRTAADLTALAIDAAQLLEAEERQFRRAETLSRAIASLTSSLELPAVLDTMLDQLRTVVEYDSASIQLLREHGLEMVAGRGFPDMELARRTASGAGINPPRVQQTILLGRAMVIPDTRADPDWIAFPGLEYIRSWIGAPLFERGALIGVLYLDHRQPNAYSEEDGALVTSFAHQAAVAITNARLYQEERERVQHLAVLNDIMRIASSTLNFDEVCQALADNMIRVIGGDECNITRWDEAAERPVPVASHGTSRELYQALRFPAGAQQTLTGRVLSLGAPLAIEDVFDSPYSNPQIAALFTSRSRLALPLIADGRKLGAVLIGFKEKRSFTEEEIARASRAAELVAIAVAKAKLHEDLTHHARGLESEVAARTQELRAANEQLRSLDRLKSHLINQIGHEFRTPAANIRTYLHLLETGRPEKRGQYLSILSEQSDVLKRLIESVTTFAEIDLSPEARPAHAWLIGSAIDKVVEHCRPDAAARSLRIQLERAGLDLPVRANPQRVARALEEIMLNAFAYTDAGGLVSLRVERVEEGDDRWVRLSVSDTGVGIPPDELPHVFDQFFRGRQRALQVRGIGMGLSLAQAIAMAEGGRITAESPGLGQGSTFRLWLPLAD
jgi:GAF domain-containing protein